MQMSAAIAIACSAIARGVERAVRRKRPGGGHRVRAARPDPHDPVVGLDQVAGAGEQEELSRDPSRRASPRAGAARGRCASPSRARRPSARAGRGTVRASPRNARRARTNRRPSRRTRRESGRDRAAGSCARVLHHRLAEGHLAVAGHHGAIVAAEVRESWCCETLSVRVDRGEAGGRRQEDGRQRTCSLACRENRVSRKRDGR